MFRLLVGGPARCGKTTAASMIAAQNPAHSLIGVDALFPAILRRPLFNRLRRRREMVAHFLTRQRYQDDGRQVTESVLDYSPLPLDAVLDGAVLSAADHPLAGYASTFDVIAKARRSDGWIAFDVHPELRFHQLRRHIPGLHLLLVFRDPLEAIAAQLYWRQPDNYRHSPRRLRRAVLLWALAARAAIRLKDAFQDRVATITLPELLQKGSERDIFGLALRGGQDCPDLDTLLFRRVDGGYRLPNGVIRLLLSPSEEATIQYLLGPLARQLGIAQPSIDAPDEAAILPGLAQWLAAIDTLARLSPDIMLATLDIADSPAASIRHQVGNCRDIFNILLRKSGLAPETK